MQQLKQKPLQAGSELCSFQKDVLSWFSKHRDGHMGKWQYYDPIYDGDPALGSVLWNGYIKSSDKYYMSSGQTQIIKNKINAISSIVGEIEHVIDLGPGDVSAVKNNTLTFLRSFEKLKSYTAVDICKSFVDDALAIIESEIPSLNLQGYNSDFFNPDLKTDSLSRNLFLCLGGIIGNYEGTQNSRTAFVKLIRELKKFRAIIPTNSYIVIGLDANQDKESLLESYDHPLHCAFEINIMHKIKRDLIPNDKGFKPHSWCYKMAWYPEFHQFCHIAQSTESQSFKISDKSFEIDPGDQFVVDNSYKFPVGVFQHASMLAGFEALASYLDDDRRMALHVLKAM